MSNFNNNNNNRTRGRGPTNRRNEDRNYAGNDREERPRDDDRYDRNSDRNFSGGNSNWRQPPQQQQRRPPRNRGRPPPQPRPADAPPPPGMPSPQNLSTKSSQEQNDPLFNKNFFSSTSTISTSIAGNDYIHPGCMGLMDIISAEYRALAAKSFNIKRNIPESAYAYYAATLVWARMLSLHGANNNYLSDEERQYVNWCKNYKPPNLLASYLAGFGDTDITNGLVIERFRLKKPAYAVGKIGNYEIPGFFGKIHDEPAAYADYPALGVFALRVMNDLKKSQQASFNGIWNLPDDLAYYTEANNNRVLHALKSACIGYVPALGLERSQIDTLKLCSITENQMNSGLTTMHYHAKLLEVVQAWINEIKDVKLSDVPQSNTGSKGQAIFCEIYSKKLNLEDCIWQSFSCDLMPAPIDYAAGAFKYRVNKTGNYINTRVFMPYQTSEEWNEEQMNVLFNLDTDEKLKVKNGSSQPYLTSQRLDTMVKIDF